MHRNWLLSFLMMFALITVGCVPEWSESDQILQDAYENQTNDLQVEGEGKVTRLLS